MTECKFCHKPLEDTEELHAMYGMLFCSKACAVAYNEREIIRNARDTAEEEYSEAAEIVATKDVLPKQKFSISVAELLETVVEIEASSEAEAVAIAEKQWHDGRINLGAEAFSRFMAKPLGKCCYVSI